MGRYTDMLSRRLRNPLPPAIQQTLRSGIEAKVKKGQKDGTCNRTACQAPLTGRKQWRMKDPTVHNGFFHYCDPCAWLFNGHDDSIQQPRRCEEVPDRMEDSVDVILAGEAIA